jgi:hypothetical protein
VQDLRRLTLVIFSLLLGLLQSAKAEVVSIAPWNLEWFPGGKPNFSEAERLVHMSAAKDALLDLNADILCLQEVRDWDSVAELVPILELSATRSEQVSGDRRFRPAIDSADRHRITLAR